MSAEITRCWRIFNVRTRVIWRRVHRASTYVTRQYIQSTNNQYVDNQKPRIHVLAPFTGQQCSNKKLSYRRETARQLPTWRRLSPSAHYPSAPSGYAYAYGRIRNPQQTYVKRASVKRTLNRAFKVIQGYPYLCRQESRTVYCRNVQLLPTLFLKLTKIWQREHRKFVDFNDPTQVWRRPSKKRLRISTNDLYCQKLELLTYIFAADSMGLHSLVFT